MGDYRIGTDRIEYCTCEEANYSICMYPENHSAGGAEVHSMWLVILQSTEYSN